MKFGDVNDDDDDEDDNLTLVGFVKMATFNMKLQSQSFPPALQNNAICNMHNLIIKDFDHQYHVLINIC